MSGNDPTDCIVLINSATLFTLQGAFNFRDVGGYPATDGCRVRHRRAFRSDHLAGLTSADMAALRSLALTRSIDYRGVAEGAAKPYQIPQVTVLAFPIEPTVLRRVNKLLALGHGPSTEDTVELMCQT